MFKVLLGNEKSFSIIAYPKIQFFAIQSKIFENFIDLELL